MKTFSELTRQELSELSEVQIDAYVDIELVQQNITKPVNVSIDFPDYLRIGDRMPERDITVYCAGSYCFPDMETAQKFVAFVNQLPTVQKDYDYSVGSEAYYATDVRYPAESIKAEQVYSEPKFTAIKEQLRQTLKNRRGVKKESDEAVETVIDYEAIDRVRYSIRGKVRDAIEFFEKAKQIASQYEKYLTVTQDADKAKEVLFTVFNVQDDELKEEIDRIINTPRLVEE